MGGILRQRGVTVAVAAFLVTVGGVLLTPQASEAAVCNTSDFCWQNPLPQGQNLEAVWGTGPNNVMTIGLSGTVLQYNGTTWSQEYAGEMYIMRYVGKRAQ